MSGPGDDRGVPAFAVPVGEDIGGYIVDGVLGSGTMGYVYAASHPIIGKRAAIKVLRPELSRSPAAVERFVMEARAVNQIGHPNIVNIFGFGTLPDGRCYYVMDLLIGESLHHRIHRGGPMHIGEAVSVIGEITSALASAHDKGIIHRDLKPENVFLTPVPDRWPKVSILDWGLLKLASTQSSVYRRKHSTVAGQLLGTPVYMSPEQARGADKVDFRTDVYSLGVMSYEMLAGTAPFGDNTSIGTLLAHQDNAVPSLAKKRPSLPPELVQLIEAMLAKEADGRPTLAAVRAVLKRLQASKILMTTAAGLALPGGGLGAKPAPTPPPEASAPPAPPAPEPPRNEPRRAKPNTLAGHKAGAEQAQGSGQGPQGTRQVPQGAGKSSPATEAASPTPAPLRPGGYAQARAQTPVPMPAPLPQTPAPNAAPHPQVSQPMSAPAARPQGPVHTLKTQLPQAQTPQPQAPSPYAAAPRAQTPEPSAAARPQSPQPTSASAARPQGPVHTLKAQLPQAQTPQPQAPSPYAAAPRAQTPEPFAAASRPQTPQSQQASPFAPAPQPQAASPFAAAPRPQTPDPFATTPQSPSPFAATPRSPTPEPFAAPQRPQTPQPFAAAPWSQTPTPQSPGPQTPSPSSRQTPQPARSHTPLPLAAPPEEPSAGYAPPPPPPVAFASLSSSAANPGYAPQPTPPGAYGALAPGAYGSAPGAYGSSSPADPSSGYAPQPTPPGAYASLSQAQERPYAPPDAVTQAWQVSEYEDAARTNDVLSAQPGRSRTIIILIAIIAVLAVTTLILLLR